MFDTIRTALSEHVFGRTPNRGKIADPAALAAALSQEAAHVAQSATYNYLRARAGFLGPKLFSEPAFLEALEITRWESYAAALADLTLIAAAAARPWLPSGGVAEEWREIFRQALSVYPPPVHRDDGWDGLIAAFAARAAQADAAPPEPPEAVAATAGRTIFAQLPLHPDVRRLDEEMVVNTVRFRMLRSWESLKDRLEWPKLAAEIRRPVSAP